MDTHTNNQQALKLGHLSNELDTSIQGKYNMVSSIYNITIA